MKHDLENFIAKNIYPYILQLKFLHHRIFFQMKKDYVKHFTFTFFKKYISTV